MENIITIREEYHNIPNEWLDLPFRPDIDEPDVGW